jgi:hypothetical protein
MCDQRGAVSGQIYGAYEIAANLSGSSPGGIPNVYIAEAP